MKVPFTFTFRNITPKAFADLVNSQDLEVPSSVVSDAFLPTEKDGKEMMRRKPVAVELELPEFCAGLDELAVSVIRDFVADYVKATYIDAFLPVGSHAWGEIQQAIAARGTGGRRAEFDISKELLEDAANSVGSFMARVLANKAAGDKFKSTVLAKYAKSAITRNIGPVDEVLIDKLQKRLDDWLEHVAVNEADNADDFATVYNMLASKLRALKGAGQSVAVADLL